MEAKIKTTLTFPNAEMDAATKVESGSGNRYHTLMNKKFESAEQYKKYLTDTGLEDTGVRQQWGTGQDNAVFRSRRGSLAGHVQFTDGTVQGWRMSSLATSEALKKDDIDEADQHYQDVAAELSKKAVNTKGTDQSVNTILSDFTKIQYNAFSGQFDGTQSTHAQGVSGVGLHKDVPMDTKKQLYEPSITTMQQRDLTPTSSLAFHSEPMAMTLHNHERSELGLGSLSDESEVVGIMESFPNQICAQCGPMLSTRVGSNSVVSGNPGRPFGGQKEGAIHPHEIKDKHGDQMGQSTVFRGAPMNEYGNSIENRLQVRAIHEAHK